MSQDSIFDGVGSRLNHLLLTAGLRSLEPGASQKFAEYLSLLQRWNARMNLTAIRDEHGILTRHFVESIACAEHLPVGVASLLDFGSGAGFPGIPIALCHPEIAVTLAESQAKKAAFLGEAVRTLNLNVVVFADRAEKLTRNYDCVCLRAVDRMERAVATASDLVTGQGWVAVLTTETELVQLQRTAGSGFNWSAPIPLPGSEQRILARGKKISLS